VAGEPLLAELGDGSVGFFRDERNEQRQLLVGDARRISATDGVRAEVAAFTLTSKQSGDGRLADVEEFRDLRVRQVAFRIPSDDSSSKVQGERNHRAGRSNSGDLRKWEPL
jgi:hypothetical protein